MVTAARRFDAKEFHPDMLVSDLLKTLNLMTAEDMRPLIVEMSGMITRNAARTVNSTTEPAWVKARRLARELQDTLRDCDDGEVMAVVYPPANEKEGPKRTTILFGEVDWRWAANVDPSAGEGDLSALVEAHKAASAAFEAAIDREGDLKEAYFAANRKEHLALLSIGGALSLYVSEDMDEAFSNCEKRMKEEYDTQIRKIGVLERIEPRLAEEAQLALHAKLSTDIAALEKLTAEEKDRQSAFGWSAAVAEYQRSSDDETKALLALLAHPCTSLEQCRAKAAYLMGVTDWQYTYLEPEQLLALLGSFGDPTSEAARQ
ncbi:hypothetical protein IG197_01700 [Aminobacter sp. SR38]|jgi:hypothetical protein|uniref:hypothetical protein n=1 Tax=Aminobacter sp. SR38 TaxID=2774562 RepID=UPI001780AC53|nr:hypothetical protein [Aminobacter sp. SR38]QOF71832.1 hypothetical protein IG197_01700 [Aminobacter sp. SR38]